jgi:hypothetical protein
MLVSDHSPSLGHWVNPDPDELLKQSQTQPYLRNEPKASVSPERIDGFFRHVLSQEITAVETNLDLSDLKYNPSKPREAETLLEKKLNACIGSLSPSEFIVHNFVRSFTAMSHKTSFLPGRSTRRRLGSIVTVFWI